MSDQKRSSAHGAPFRRTHCLTLVSIAALLAGASSARAATDGDSLKNRLNDARLRYDLSAAEAARDEVRVWNAQQPVEASNRLLGEASLLVAELYRIQFEEEKEARRPERRELGKAIDAAAQEGLKALESVAPDSEVWRMRADLIGTMIRSEFQAQRHRKKMDGAIAQALALDPKNARAYASQSKTFLFAPENHGRDLEKGIEVLDKALAIDPKLEPALLLRAYANEQLGRRDRAISGWTAALQLNPTCKPAKDKLEPKPPSTPAANSAK